YPAAPPRLSLSAVWAPRPTRPLPDSLSAAFARVLCCLAAPSAEYSPLTDCLPPGGRGIAPRSPPRAARSGKPVIFQEDRARVGQGEECGMDVRALNEIVARESAFIDDVMAEIGKVIVGQNYMIDRILIGLLAGGHVLLEGVPG